MKSFENIGKTNILKNTGTKENLVYLFIWTLLLLAPIISMYLRMADDTTMEFSWSEVIRSWRIFMPIIIVFLIHNFILAPLLIYRKKNLLYWLGTLSLILVFQVYECNDRPTPPDLPRHTFHNHHPAPPDRDGFTPPELVDSNSPSKPDIHHEAQNPPAPGVHPHEPFTDGHAPRPAMRHHNGPKNAPPVFWGQEDIIALIIMVMMLGMNLGVKLYFKSWRDAKALETLEKKNLEQQLEYLKYQINPHFFMNTLNNIHALVDIEPEEAKHSIVELSKMMRYVLYEGAKSRVPLSKDIAFINHYITLMKLRYTDKVKISTDFPASPTDKMVPPMLFITFVENAFKHGVSYKQASFIDISIKTTDDHLVFTCSNSKAEEGNDLYGGVGLANTRQRLDLIYGTSYTLQVDNGSNSYAVMLQIPFLFET